MLLLVLGLLCFCCWMKKSRVGRHRSMDDDIEKVTGPRRFSHRELVAATNNLANELGRGGFGVVYTGFLIDRNCHVAVKRVTPESQQGLKEYISEVKTISRLRHRNLVELIGWCRKGHELIIVYEYMPNKSLDVHLFNKKSSLLTWERRYHIALGLASALSYLQEECEPYVLHRDIKPSNVLLDLDFNAKLSDFGLARLVEHGNRSGTTTILMGTPGYVAPEYAQRNKASKESDVYSFGIVALQVACGKPAIQEDHRNGTKIEMKLVEWVWAQYGRGNVLAAADPRLSHNYDQEQMKRLILVGLACAHPNHHDRLSIRQAIDVLEFKASLPVLPTN